VPFGYDESIKLEDFHYLMPILFGVLLFNLAYKLSYSKSGIPLPIQPAPKYGRLAGLCSLKIKKKHLALIVIQLMLLIYWWVKILLNYSIQQNNDSIVIFRVLVGKESFFLLFLQSLLPILAFGVTRSFLLVTSLFVAFLFAWFDGSRSSLLPLSLVMLSTLYLGKKAKFVSIISVQMYIYVFAAHSRYINGKLSLDNLTTNVMDSFYQVSDGVAGLFGYIFGYSLLHYIATIKSGLGQFQFLDLIYSIIPLPSWLIPITIDTSLWRVDRYRPMGALAELSRVSDVFTYTLFIILGWLAKSLDRISNYTVKSLSLPIFFLICVTMFQYHLRALQWFLILQVILIFLDKKLKKV